MSHLRPVKYTARAVIAVLFLLAGALHAGAQDVAAWFSRGTNSQIYGTVRAELEVLSAALAKAGLSDSLLVVRLAEAAGKKVSAPQLLDALRVDVARSVSMAHLLAGRGLMPTDARKASQLAEQALIFFRAGMSEDDLAAILAESSVRLGTKAKPDAVVARSMAVMALVADMQAVYGLSAAERLELGRTLASSSLPDSRLNSLTEKIVALVRKNRPVSEAIDSVVTDTRGSSGKPESPGSKPDSPGKPGNGSGGKGKGK